MIPASDADASGSRGADARWNIWCWGRGIEIGTVDTQDLASWREQGVSRRHYQRWGVEVSAIVRIGEQRFECVVYDLSPGGARVTLREPLDLDIGTEVALKLAATSAEPCREQACIGARILDIRFDILRIGLCLAQQSPVEYSPGSERWQSGLMR